MNASAELLNFIYQNSQMGVTTLPHLIEGCTHEELKNLLCGQLREYHAIHDEAARQLAKQDLDEQGLSAFEKLRTYLMLSMQTLTDHSPSHLAELLIQGSSMGIIDAIKHLHRYEGDPADECLVLMRRLQGFEEDNIERLKPYL